MTSLPATPIKIVIVDDSELVRTGLRALLSSEPRLKIVAEAGSVATGISTVLKEKPQVVLMDIRLPDGTGFDACRQILEKSSETRILFLTSVVDDAMMDKAIRSGGHGYLLKEINGKGLIDAICDVASGKSILDPSVTDRVLKLVKSGGAAGNNPLEKLSPQERKVLNLIAEGNTNKEVGLKLNLSEKTVKNYLGNIFDKLSISRRSQAAALYSKHAGINN